MRILIVIIALSGTMLIAQEPRSVPTCRNEGQRLVTDAYYRAVLERALRPPDWQVSLISISVSVAGSESRVFIRETGGKFELLRGAPEKSIREFLIGLAASCQLPAEPLEAAELAKINWRSAGISPATFKEMHRGFTTALRQYVSRIRSRRDTLLSTRVAYVRLHTAQYCVTYDNKFEHLEVRADDDANEVDPIVAWARTVLKLSERVSPRSEGRGEGTGADGPP